MWATVWVQVPQRPFLHIAFLKLNFVFFSISFAFSLLAFFKCITMAAFVFLPDLKNNSFAFLKDTLQTVEIIPIALLINFLFVGLTSIIKFLKTFPFFIMDIELSIFKIIFCAVPDFSLVEPCIISSLISGEIE